MYCTYKDNKILLCENLCKESEFIKNICDIDSDYTLNLDHLDISLNVINHINYFYTLKSHDYKDVLVNKVYKPLYTKDSCDAHNYEYKYLKYTENNEECTKCNNTGFIDKPRIFDISKYIKQSYISKFLLNIYNPKELHKYINLAKFLDLIDIIHYLVYDTCIQVSYYGENDIIDLLNFYTDTEKSKDYKIIRYKKKVVNYRIHSHDGTSTSVDFDESLYQNKHYMLISPFMSIEHCKEHCNMDEEYDENKDKYGSDSYHKRYPYRKNNYKPGDYTSYRPEFPYRGDKHILHGSGERENYLEYYFEKPGIIYEYIDEYEDNSKFDHRFLRMICSVFEYKNMDVKYLKFLATEYITSPRFIFKIEKDRVIYTFCEFCNTRKQEKYSPFNYGDGNDFILVDYEYEDMCITWCCNTILGNNMTSDDYSFETELITENDEPNNSTESITENEPNFILIAPNTYKIYSNNLLVYNTEKHPQC